MNTRASQESSLRTYMVMLRRGAPIVIVTTVLLIGVAVLLSSRQEALYQASTDVVVDTSAAGSALSDQGGSQPERVLETQESQARVPEVIGAALAQLPTRTNYREFLSRSTVNADPNADILTFSVTASRPDLAEELATAYANGYIEFRRRRAKASLNREQLEVQERLASLREAKRTRGTLYATLTEKSQQLRTREVLLDSIASRTGAVQDAVQVQPHTKRNAVLGGMFGIVLGIGLVVVREALNTRVRTATDVAEHLDLPLIGRLYTPPKHLRIRDELTMLASPEAPAAESFKLLATNIEFLNIERGARSFMATSADPREGKSTSIANLAVTFARSGKRVILVDLDLRRPVIHRFFELTDGPGVTQVALGQVWLSEALVSLSVIGPAADAIDEDDHTEHSLEILTAGRLPPNPSEFMQSQALSDVLDRLEERADLVLIDAPAMLAVSDAVSLTPKVDALLVFTRVPAVRRGALTELRRILDNAPVAKFGFVLTGAEQDGEFAAGRGYGYGYGYGRKPSERRGSVTPS